jgi:hypothetical protein
MVSTSENERERKCGRKFKKRLKKRENGLIKGHSGEN